MANNVGNDHAKDHEAKHEHEGSSIGFYIFIALVLGVITYVEFALVEHQTTWFAMLSPFWIFFWLILLSVIKFILVVMFFMHLKGDHMIFTGFFTSGMVIAVGTLFILSAMFTVRSVAMAEPRQEASSEAHGEAHGEEAEAVEINPEQPLVHSLEYPAPKNQAAFDYSPLGDAMGGSETAGETTRLGLPRAPEAQTVALVNPFSAEGSALASTASGDTQEGAADPEAGDALFHGSLGCSGCHGVDAKGGVGPNLTDSEWIYGGTEADITETLNNGRPGGMPAFSGQASPEDIANLVAYVQSLSGAGSAQSNAGGSQ